MHNKIPTAFISFAATELTNHGLTGSKLVEIASAYAVDFNVDIPHARYPFMDAELIRLLKKKIAPYLPGCI